MSYTLNSVDLSTYGIIPGHSEGSNIAMAGIYDFPARIGDTFKDWGDEDGIEPFVLADEIFFAGRDIIFTGSILGDNSTINNNLQSLYNAINAFTDLVTLSTPYGDFSVQVKEVKPEYLSGGANIIITFREPIVTLTGGSLPAAGASNYTIDSIPFSSFGLYLSKAEALHDLPELKDQFFTKYGSEGYQIVKRKNKILEFNGFIIGTSITDFQNKIKALYLLFKTPSARIMNLNSLTALCYLSEGFAVENILFHSGGIIANIKMELVWIPVIENLDMVFWIEDTTVVVNGYLVDKSGNNKQIAVSTVNEVNDTITMPANDTDIINALKADGMYDYFYTNDSTPNACKIGYITAWGSRRLFSQYSYKNFFLLASAPTERQINDIYTLFGIEKVWLPSTNIIKQLNYNRPVNPDALIALSEYSSQLRPNDQTITTNTYVWSDSRKTQTFSLPGTGETRFANTFYIWRMSGGAFKLSFWVNRTDFGADDTLACYFALALEGYSVNVCNYSKVNLNTLNYSTTGALGDYTYITTIKDIKGDHSRIEVTGFIPLYHFYFGSSENPAANSCCVVSIGLWSATPSAQDFKVVDLVLTKDYNKALMSGNVLSAPYEIMQSAIVNKNLCIIGDSITLGGSYGLHIQHNYGLNKVYNCGYGGRRMVHFGGTELWQDLPIVITQPAEILTILASANDCVSPIGTIDSVDDDTYLGAYNNYLTYLLANLPVENEKVILITAPFIVGAGNTIAEGKALYQKQFIDMANGVKALGVKYDLPVCDLHGLMPMTYENSAIFLSDKVHWTFAMHSAAGDIIGKFINDLYTYTATATTPKPISAVVYEASPIKLVVIFSDVLDDSVPAASAFTITGKTITSVEVNKRTVVLTVSVAFNPASSPMLTYTKPGSNQLIRASDAIDVPSFMDQVIEFDFSVLDIIEDGNTNFWMASQDLLTITKDSGTDEVSVVSDKLMSGKTLTSAINLRAIWSTGGLLFDGVDDKLTGTFTFNKPSTVYLLMKLITWTNITVVMSGQVGGPMVQCYNESPQLIMTDGAYPTPGIVVPLDTWFVLTVVNNGANSTIQVNNGTPVTSNLSNLDWGGIVLGNYFGGDCASSVQIREGVFRNGLDSEAYKTVVYNHLFGQI